MSRINEYDDKAYKMASENTNYNSAGKTVIEKNDEWRNEKEWDNVFEQLQKEKCISLYLNQQCNRELKCGVRNIKEV